MEVVAVALLGLAVGSFLNVLIWRLNDPAAPKFWEGWSICPKCKHRLSWKDNIPLLSFVLLKGRCRYCGKEISWQYPVVELVTAIYFGLTGFHPVLWFIGAVFIVIFFSDLIYGLIPDEMIVVGVAVGLIGPMGQLGQVLVNVLTGILSATGFFLVVLATRFRGMGLGDVKLAFLIGLLLGWPKVLVAFWSSFVVGGIVAFCLLLLKRTKFSATIPLGPFLILGTIISALWSKDLLRLLGLL